MTLQQPKDKPHKVFEKIRLSKALSSIQLRAERALARYQDDGIDLSPTDMVLLKQIIHADDLDEVHLICAERLGHDDEAKKLRTCISGKAERGDGRAIGIVL
jgi:hypothetical protein